MASRSGASVSHPGLRFPIGAIEQFMKQCVPRWTTNEQAAQAAYDALIAEVGESIVIAHSQGATFALGAAAARIASAPSSCLTGQARRTFHW